MTRFILAVHCHQPVGNFGWVVEEAYRSAYLPFIEMLEKHPKVKVVLHYSGSLLDWFQARHPEFLKRLKVLVQRGQAELLGGGYYEPILTMLPEQDAVGQLEEMNQALDRLGLNPKGSMGKIRGAWLAERVWEPQLPSLLSQAGIRYTIVDDHHLELAGVAEKDRFGYYLSEDRGEVVAIFPSSKTLRYLVPFKPVEEVIQALKNLSSDRSHVVVLADDGEKFGLWPGTNRWVYQEGWLESFFSQLERSNDWLKLMTFRECLETMPPLGRLNLPCAGYEEMDGWSGGSFRNFLVKYPEADTMYKKMLWVSRRLRQMKKGSLHEEARRYLYMAQSNDAYWHGIFGGLYLRHLRKGVYEHLLKAEQALDDSEKKKDFWIQGEALDMDADQSPEYLLRSRFLTLLVDPDCGGRLLELSDKVSGLNLLDTLTRRPEPYHKKVRNRQTVHVGAEAGSQGPATIHERAEDYSPDLSDLLVYDPYRRAGWIDHLLTPGAQLQEFVHGKREETETGDFLEGRYESRMKQAAGSVEAVLTRNGTVTVSGDPQPLSLTKKIRLTGRGRAVAVSYQLVNTSNRRLEFLFGNESSFSLKDAHVNRIGEADGIERFAVTDPAAHLQICWAFSRPARLWYFPLETVSDSDRGMERTYQGVNLTFLWPLTLEPNGSWTVSWRFQIESLDGKN